MGGAPCLYTARRGDERKRGRAIGEKHKLASDKSMPEGSHRVDIPGVMRHPLSMGLRLSSALWNVVVLAILCACLVVCPCAARLSPSIAPAPVLLWSEVGYGVYGAELGRSTERAANVFIGYAGYSVQATWSQTWVQALSDAQLHNHSITHFFAVQGPQDPEYSAREIANTKLIASILSIPSIDRIIVAAHSSGSYVAQEMLFFLYTKGLDYAKRTDGRIEYYNLDGGSEYLSESLLSHMNVTYFTYALDDETSTYSPNYSEMVQLASDYQHLGNAFSLQLNVAGCGCEPFAVWCVHDTMICQVPHDSSTFDLEADYTEFSVFHPVTAQYLAHSLPPSQQPVF